MPTRTNVMTIAEKQRQRNLSELSATLTLDAHRRLNYFGELNGDNEPGTFTQGKTLNGLILGTIKGPLPSAPGEGESSGKQRINTTISVKAKLRLQYACITRTASEPGVCAFGTILGDLIFGRIKRGLPPTPDEIAAEAKATKRKRVKSAKRGGEPKSMSA